MPEYLSTSAICAESWRIEVSCPSSAACCPNRGAATDWSHTGAWQRVCMVLAVALAACFNGCSYLHDRLNDLLDPFRVDVGFGPGLYADVRATDFMAVGAGGQTLETAGIHGRFIGTGKRGQVGLPGLAMVGEIRGTEMAPLLGDTSEFDEQRDVVPGQVLIVFPAMHAGRTGTSDWWRAHRGVHVADVGASVTVFVGVSLGFSPGEVLDLLLGFVGVDLAGDDVADRPDPAQPRSTHQ